ncbi:MAG: aminotransferase class I/II-fold pyridoxal phosphate-dependent enzyme [Lachnospiraceae bacterium]|nr:aminotransferase class I/II-fold pyridoxal phosphate-dependent enzyme [Lachnospiraceae bacterium]
MSFERFESKLWLATPTMHGEEQAYVKEAFDTNWVSTVGANLDALEKGICEKVGCKYAVALSAGTAALHLAVKLAGIQPGDKVMCSDMTFAATVNPVAYEKGEQIFIDTEYDTWNMDPLALEKAFQLYPDAKAVVVANLYGTPAKLDEIQTICKKYNAVLIEDAAESLGATYKGIQTGTFGAYNAISFNGNKIITTSGGGMLLTDDKDAADKARKWSTQARENAPWYQHEEYGYNYRMSNILAGIGRGQLLHLEEHIARKKEIYMRYKEGFKGLPVQMNPYMEDSMKPNFWLSCVIINKEAMCKQVRTATEASYESEPGKSCPTEILERLAEYNVEGRPIWKPMHLQPICKNNLFVTANGTDVGADIFDRGLCLPSDIKMTEEQQKIVIEIVKSCFE